MKIRWLAILGLTSVAAMAQTASPFAAYDAVVSRALDSALEKALEAPQDAVAVAVPPEVTTSPAPAPVSLPDFVSGYANRFRRGRTENLRLALGRLTPIRPVLERILSEEGVPSQFAAVVLVESGANPLALSPKSARGLWQFMPDTARRYGLVVNDQQDDRVDLFKSTRAAARYLRDLYHAFGEWRLALAAYDAGEGAVHEAIQRGHSFDFQLLSDRRLVPAETRSYVPAVFAAANLLITDSDHRR